MHRRIHSVFAAGAVAALLLGATVATAGMSGAIFTTNDMGEWVNGNVYDSAGDVYLNGGPRANQNCSAGGLPNGPYYFQVTDPSGKELLSGYGDTNGVITVSDGHITGYAGGSHGQGVGRCPDDITVQLSPFGPTSNPGSEYKVWLTRQADYACTPSPNPTCSGTFGFFSSSSKTDNFKVQAPDGIPD